MEKEELAFWFPPLSNTQIALKTWKVHTFDNRNQLTDQKHKPSYVVSVGIREFGITGIKLPDLGKIAMEMNKVFSFSGPVFSCIKDRD